MQSKEGDPVRENVGSCNDCPLPQVLLSDMLSPAPPEPLGCFASSNEMFGGVVALN